MDDLTSVWTILRELIRSENQATRTELRSELQRVEEVMDARLRHLEDEC